MEFIDLNKKEIKAMLPKNLFESDVLSEDSKKILATFIENLMHYTLAKKSKTVIASNAQLAKLLRNNKTRLYKAINQLQDCALIERETGKKWKKGEKKGIASTYRVLFENFNKPIKQLTWEDLYKNYLEEDTQTDDFSENSENEKNTLNKADLEQFEPQNWATNTYTDSRSYSNTNSYTEAYTDTNSYTEAYTDTNSSVIKASLSSLTTHNSDIKAPTVQTRERLEEVGVMVENLEEGTSGEVGNAIIFSSGGVEGIFEYIKARFAKCHDADELLEVRVELIQKLGKERFNIGTHKFNRIQSFISSEEQRTLERIANTVEGAWANQLQTAKTLSL